MEEIVNALLEVCDGMKYVDCQTQAITQNTDEKVPYSFYVDDVEIMVDLNTTLAQQVRPRSLPFMSLFIQNSTEIIYGESGVDYFSTARGFSSQARWALYGHVARARGGGASRGVQSRWKVFGQWWG